LRLAARFRAHLSSVEKAMGAVLVATGLLVFVGAMPAIGGWLLEYAPILGRIG
jgi:cytochrome c-type biogenesis protein